MVLQVVLVVLCKRAPCLNGGADWQWTRGEACIWPAPPLGSGSGSVPATQHPFCHTGSGVRLWSSKGNFRPERVVWVQQVARFHFAVAFDLWACTTQKHGGMIRRATGCPYGPSCHWDSMR